MTFDQLEMLEAIVDKGSFKAAADFLHKSQPSLSVGIKKLEEEFDIKIFDRSDYRPHLTKQGIIFYRWSKECLEGYRNLQMIGKDMGKHHVEPNLTIIIDPLVQFSDIQQVFQNCLGPKTPTELTLRTEILNTGVEMLLNEEADIAIGLNLAPAAKIESVLFKTVKMIPVATKKVASDHKKYPQIIVTSRDTHQNSLSSGPKCYVSEHAMKYKLIQAGHGWGRLAEHEIPQSLTKVNDSIVKPTQLELYIMRLRQKSLGPLAKNIWHELLHRK